jgi:hypothetical protein
MALSEIRLGISAKLQLAVLCGGFGINACGHQSTQMIGLLSWVHYVYRFVAARETILDEWKQNPIFLFVAGEKRADMSNMIEPRAGK